MNVSRPAPLYFPLHLAYRNILDFGEISHINTATLAICRPVELSPIAYLLYLPLLSTFYLLRFPYIILYFWLYAIPISMKSFQKVINNFNPLWLQ